MQTFSKIWREAKKKNVIPDISFAEWLQSEQDIFEKRKPNFKKEWDFNSWLNKRYKMKGLNISDEISADATTEKKSFLDKALELTTAVKDIVAPTSKESEELKAQKAESEAAKLDKRILGLNPIAFYMLTGTVLIITIYGVYKLVKKNKK